MEIIFEKFEKETSLERQRKLFIECFPETLGTSVVGNDHYLWKFHSFPHYPKSFEYEALLKNEILGYYAAIPYRYNFFGKQVTVGMVCDVMTGVKARGKGVFTKLGAFSTNQMKEQGLAFTTGYPIRKEVIPGHLKVGWEIQFELPLYIKFLKMNSLLKSKKLSLLTPIANLGVMLYRGILRILQLLNDKELRVDIYSEKEIEKIIGLDEFIAAWQKEVPISLIKDINFLKWRLGGPGKSYFVNVVKNKGIILGVSISRKILKDNVLSLGILDFMVLNNNNKVINILHRSLTKLAFKNKIETILCMTSEFIKRKYKFISNGFIKSPFKFFLIIKRLDNTIDGDQLKDAQNWHLMWIDSDDL
jgi:hypothetical protein